MTTSGESPAGAPRKPRCVGGLRYGEQLSWVSPSGASDFSASDITVTASAAPPVPTIGTDPFYQIAAAVTAYNPGAFVRDFAVLSITTALTGPLAGALGEGAEAGTAAAADVAAGAAADASTEAGLTEGTVFNLGADQLGGETTGLTAHALEQATARGVTRSEIEEALSHVPKSDTNHPAAFVFNGRAARVVVSKITGKIVTVIARHAPGSPTIP